MFKDCQPFTDCISKINNTQVHNVKDLEVVILMHNLIEYNANYSKTSGNLWQCYRDKTYDDATVNSESSKSKIRITGKTPTDGNTKDFEIAVSLKHLRNFWRSLKTPLINWEINLIPA